MRYKEINEAVTSQGFKFGFELECIGPNGFHISTMNLPVELNQDSDDSIVVDSENENTTERGYEFISNPLVLNPKNIIAAKQTILDMLKAGFRTNGTCGLHIHYSFDRMTFGDICWFLLGLSLNGDLKTQFSNFYDIEFFNETYADLKFLDEIPNAIASGDEDRIAKLFSTYKFRLLRIHPQGTIEWRGPRDFMNSGEMKSVGDFFLRLYKCADIIHKLSSTDTFQVGGKSLQKNQFIKMLSGTDAGNTESFLKKGNTLDKSMDLYKSRGFFKRYPWLNNMRFSDLLMYSDDNGLVIHGGTITGGTIKECMINGIEVENVDINGAMLVNTMVSGGRVIKVQAQGCGFEKCKISDSTLMHCEFERSTINNSMVDGQHVDNEKIT